MWSEQLGRRKSAAIAAVCLGLAILAAVWSGPQAASARTARALPCGRSAAAPRGSGRGVVRLQETAPVMFRVNQIGYVLGCPKFALVMTRGPERTRRFEVLTPSGRLVYRGGASEPRRWNSRYLVYRLAFDPVNRAGSYVLSFAGRRSPRIRVASARTIYLQVADAALAFLQSQRDGPDVIPGIMRRRPSHLADANAMVYRLPAYRGTRLEGTLVPTGLRHDVSGGWFDAGDYLKFAYTASFTDDLLLYTARDYSSGVSDPAGLLAEARFGTDWLLKMWDGDQRVLYFQVGIGDGNGGSILGDHDLWRLPQADDRGSASPRTATYYATHRPVFAANAPGRPISPALAGRVAASFGLCAQVFAQRDPAYASRCLQAGQALLDQADTHPRGPLLSVLPRAYYPAIEWRADLELGAIELSLGTAAIGPSTPGLPHPDPNYYVQVAGDWANTYMSDPRTGQDSFNLYDVSTLADADLIRALRTPQTQEYFLHGPGDIPTDVPSILSDRHDQLALAAGLARRDPFGLADPARPADTVSHALGYSIQARLYDDLRGGSTFEPLSQQQLGWTLGANPWGSSFVVGAGSVFPRCLANQIPNLSGSLTGRGRLLRGAVVQGPTLIGNLTDPGAPDGYRACPRHDQSDPYRAQAGQGMGYLDDARSSASSEASDDNAALVLLAAAQQAAEH